MPVQLLRTVRYSDTASYFRKKGFFASVATCSSVTNDEWVTRTLTRDIASLTVGDLALVCEYAPQQWQRDLAARSMPKGT